MIEGVREALVKLVMESEGIERGAAEERANLLMERGADPAVVEQQMAIYASWMDNYPVHPVLGRHWTEEQAECAIVTMMRVEGVARTGRLMNDARTGGMSVEDAQALVQPVAYCVDLMAMVRAELTSVGVPQDLDCLLAGVVEEEVATWYVAVFTDGPAGFNAALSEGVDLTCPTAPLAIRIRVGPRITGRPDGDSALNPSPQRRLPIIRGTICPPDNWPGGVR